VRATRDFKTPGSLTPATPFIKALVTNYCNTNKFLWMNRSSAMRSISIDLETRFVLRLKRVRLSRILLFELSIKCVSALVIVCGSVIFILANATS